MYVEDLFQPQVYLNYKGKEITVRYKKYDQVTPDKWGA